MIDLNKETKPEVIPLEMQTWSEEACLLHLKIALHQGPGCSHPGLH